MTYNVDKIKIIIYLNNKLPFFFNWHLKNDIAFLYYSEKYKNIENKVFCVQYLVFSILKDHKDHPYILHKLIQTK